LLIIYCNRVSTTPQTMSLLPDNASEASDVDLDMWNAFLNEELPDADDDLDEDFVPPDDDDDNEEEDNANSGDEDSRTKPKRSSVYVLRREIVDLVHDAEQPVQATAQAGESQRHNIAVPPELKQAVALQLSQHYQLGVQMMAEALALTTLYCPYAATSGTAAAAAAAPSALPLLLSHKRTFQQQQQMLPPTVPLSAERSAEAAAALAGGRATVTALLNQRHAARNEARLMAEMRSNALMQRSGRNYSNSSSSAAAAETETESDAPARVRTRFNAGDLPEWRTDSMFEVPGLLKADALQQQLVAQLQQLPPVTRQQEAAAAQAAATAVVARQQACAAAAAAATTAGTTVKQQAHLEHPYAQRRDQEAQEQADVLAARLSLAPSRAGQAVRAELQAAGAAVHEALLPRPPVQLPNQRPRVPGGSRGHPEAPTPPATPFTDGEEQLCIAGLQRYGKYHWDVLQRSLLPHRTVSELQAWLQWQEWLWRVTAGQTELYSGPSRCARDYFEERRNRTAFSSMDVSTVHIYSMIVHCCAC
jgi:hypothetical protein